MSKTWKVRVKQLRDTESNWASKNPVLLAGEMAFSSDRNGLFKVGDGKSKWSDLDYAEASSISWNNVTNRPTKLSAFTNDSGFITGVTKAMITTALGYTPPEEDTNTWRPIVDDLTSDSTFSSLSAYQGKVLKGLIDGKQAAGNYALKSEIPTSLPASDVPSWAKQSSKPSYSWSEIGSRPTALSSFTNDSGFITGITKAMVTTALGYTPPSKDTTYSDATTSAHGLMTAAMVTKLNGIATGATAVTDSTVSGWGYKKTDTNTWIAFKGATTSAAGTAGYAPAPSAGAANRYLRSDGTWAVPPDTNTWRGIQNNLTSTSTTDSLSAAQGKALKDSLNSHTHSSLKIGSNTLNFVIGTSPTGLGSTSVVLRTNSGNTYNHIGLSTSNFLKYAADSNDFGNTFKVSPASGYTFNTSSYATIGVRIGHICFISFVLNNSIKGGAFYTVATIPSGYRPIKQTALIKQSNGNSDVSLIIGSDGNVKLYYYASTSSSTNGVHVSATYSL